MTRQEYTAVSLAENDAQQSQLHSTEPYTPAPTTPLENDLNAQTPPTTPGASLLSCAINLANTVAGAGMLGLPGAYAGSGIITGTLLLFIASFFSSNGLRLLSISATTVGISPSKPSSFYSVASAALPELTIFIDAAVAIKCFGVATGYFVTVGDCMVDALEFFTSPERRHAGGGGLEHETWEALLISRHFWVLSGLILVLPISFFRTLDALRFASTVSLGLIYALAVGIVLYANGVFDPCEGMEEGVGNGSSQIVVGVEDSFGMSTEIGESADNATNSTQQSCRGDIELVTTVPSTLKNLAIFVFAFTCHQNIFTVVNEIENRTQPRLNKVIVLAISSALILYLTVAIEGYMTYGSNVEGDILLNYPQTTSVTIMRIFISAMVILSYPLQLDPSRRCITSLLNEIHEIRERRKRKRNDTAAAAAAEPNEMKETKLGTTKTVDESSLENDDDDDDVFEPDQRIIFLHDSQSDAEDVLFERTTQNFLFYGITCTFLVSSFVIAMLVSDLGVVLSVVGATGSTMVSYILPGAIYLKLHPGWDMLKVLALVQLVLGCVIVPTALYFVIFCGASA